MEDPPMPPINGYINTILQMKLVHFKPVRDDMKAKIAPSFLNVEFVFLAKVVLNQKDQKYIN